MVFVISMVGDRRFVYGSASCGASVQASKDICGHSKDNEGLTQVDRTNVCSLMNAESDDGRVRVNWTR